MAVEAVHLQRIHVNRVAERDRLHRAVPLRRRGAAVCREHGGECRYTYEARHCKPSASQVHPRFSCKGELINRLCEDFHKRSTGGKMFGQVVPRKMCSHGCDSPGFPFLTRSIVRITSMKIARR